MKENSLNPYSVMCIVKHEGQEVGRVAAAANNAAEYLADLASRYGSISVEYAENATEAMIDQMVRSGVR